MKKLFMGLIAAFLVCGAAFADIDSKSLELGVTYGVINSVSAKDNTKYSTNNGWGFHVGLYDDVATVIGIQTNFFCFFPKTLEYVSGKTVIDASKLGFTTPYAISADLMLMLNIPLGLMDIRAGAGIGYTFRENNDNGTALYNNFIAFPITGDILLHLGNVVGLKAGCDIQFVFYSWKVEGRYAEEIHDLKTYVFLPHVSLSFSF